MKLKAEGFCYNKTVFVSLFCRSRCLFTTLPRRHYHTGDHKWHCPIPVLSLSHPCPVPVPTAHWDWVWNASAFPSWGRWWEVSVIQTRVWIWDSLVKAPPVTVHSVLCSAITSADPSRLMVSGIDVLGFVCFFLWFLFVCSRDLLLLFVLVFNFLNLTVFITHGVDLLLIVIYL